MDKSTIGDTSKKLKLIYYFDALCGWCYGFSSVMSKIEQTYGDQFEIEVISGGLFLGNRVGPINEIAPYIKEGAYKNVETRTGVQFGEAFLADLFDEGKMILDSLPPTIALCIVREQYPEHELKFASMLLKAVYSDGLNPVDIEGLANCAAQINVDKADFKVKMAEEKYSSMAEKEFEKFHASQYSAMPALVLEKQGKQIPLSRGFMDFEDLKTRLDSILVLKQGT